MAAARFLLSLPLRWDSSLPRSSSSPNTKPQKPQKMVAPPIRFERVPGVCACGAFFFLEMHVLAAPADHLRLDRAMNASQTPPEHWEVATQWRNGGTQTTSTQGGRRVLM